MNYAAITASIVVILAGIHAARSVLAPVFMATFLAVLLLPPMKWLRSKGISQITSLVIVILTVLVIGTATTTILTTQLKQFADDLPRYRDRLSKTLLNHNIDFDDIFPFWKSSTEETPGSEVPTGEKSSSFGQPEKFGPIRATAFVGESLNAAAEPEPISSLAVGDSSADWVLPAADLATATDQAASATLTGEEETASGAGGGATEEYPPHIPERWGVTSEEAVTTGSNELYNFLRTFIGEMTVFASSAFIIMLLVIFMLVEAARLPAKVAVALVNRRSFTNDRLKRVTDDIRRYMMIKTFVSILVGLFVTALLMIMRVQYPFLWGVIAFLLNYIPNIGSVIAALPPILLATVDIGLPSGLIVMVGAMAINCGIGYILEPKLLGEGLDLSPLVVLLSLIFCGWLLGPVGMFLSPPLAVISKIILQSFPETRWIAVLMANRVPREDELKTGI